MPLHPEQVKLVQRHLEQKFPEGLACAACGERGPWHADVFGIPQITLENEMNTATGTRLVAVHCRHCNHVMWFSDAMLLSPPNDASTNGGPA